MADDGFLIPGGAAGFRPADGCPVAMAEYTSGVYLAHRGDPESFMAATCIVADGSAEVVVTLWRCVYCRSIIIGIGKPGNDDSVIGAELTWYEEVP